MEHIKYESVISEDRLKDPSASSSHDGLSEPSTAHPLSWRPTYLRRRVLLSFIATFIASAAAIEVLVAFSKRNQGIATSRSSLHYLWTYGPTAFLTAVAALWARTEYQSKLVAPWANLSKHPASASRTVLLDYISKHSIAALFSSIRDNGFAVALTLSVSILIKVLIVLSSGLISLTLTPVTRDSYPMLLTDEFVGGSNRLANPNALPYDILIGLRSHNLSFPPGLSSGYAFQSVQTDLPNTGSETRVTVDGLKNSLQCEEVDLQVTGAFPPTDILSNGGNMLNVSITSAGCNVGLANLPGVGVWSSELEPTLFVRFQEVQCDDAVDGRRLLIVFGNLTYHPDNSSTSPIPGFTPLAGTLNNSSQFLCTPSYSIDRVEVVQNGTQLTRVVPVQGAPNRTLDTITAWNIAAAHFIAYEMYSWGDGSQVNGNSLNVSGTVVDIDPVGQAMILFAGVTDPTQLLEPAVLERSATSYYQQMSAIMSRQYLTQPASQSTTGAATTRENRLTIRPSVSQSMVGLLAACALFTAALLFMVPGTSGILPHNPSTPLNSLAVYMHSHELLGTLRYTGASTDKALARLLGPFTFKSGIYHDYASSHDQFYVGMAAQNGHAAQPPPQTKPKKFNPLVLRPVVRAAICLVTVGLIVTLEVLLYESRRNDGLGTIADGDDDYLHYAWTVVPAIVLGSLSIVYSAVDFQIRTLAPYIALRGGISKDFFRQFDLLDMTVPVAIFKELKFKRPWLFATTATILISSLFTTLSASLFQELSVPVSTSMTFRASDSFDGSLFSWFTTDDTAGQLSSLILQSNLSFPQFTYEDLAFPRLTPSLSSAVADDTTNISMSAVIPAMRGQMRCHSYTQSDFAANVSVTRFTRSSQSRVNVAFDNSLCSSKFDDIDPNTISFSVNNGSSYFGWSGAWLDTQRLCSDLVYVWGKWDEHAHALQHIEAMACNVTLQVVEVDTTFVGNDFEIDSRNPPRVSEDTARSTTLDNEISQVNIKVRSYQSLAEVTLAPETLDPFFTMLATSPWAVPIEALADPSLGNVSAAIRFQHGIIQAQALASILGPANATNTTLPMPIASGANDAQPLYDFTVTNADGARRVFQDATSTHVLAALLGATLVLFVAGWIGNPGTDVMPRNPTSIASVAALIAGGNVLDRIPADVTNLDELALALGGPNAKFWLGSGSLPDEEGRLMGDDVQASGNSFGIFVIEEEQEIGSAYGGNSHQRLSRDM